MTAKKPWTILYAILLAALALQCNGKDGDEDADADADADEDVSQEDVQPEDVTPEDVPAEDVAADDVAEEDAAEEEVPIVCEPVAVSCEDWLTDQTTVGSDNQIGSYLCSSEDESGGERLYSFTMEGSDRHIINVLLTTEGADLDLFVLTEPCDQRTCMVDATDVGPVERALIMPSEMPAYFNIVVDGKDGAEGAFEIAFLCLETTRHEICDNGTDDNDNGLIDCSDGGCSSEEHCQGPVVTPESDCGNDVDEDDDGYTDCQDYDCAGDDACTGGTGQIGDACVDQDDCETGRCQPETQNYLWPGGACTLWPEPYVHDCSTLTCPDGSSCGIFDYAGCFADCTDSTDCRAGWECSDSDGDTSGDICTPACTEDSHCAVLGACDRASGRCRPPFEICDNSADENGNELIDCDDPECGFDDACSAIDLAGGESRGSATPITPPDGERGRVIVNGTTTGASDDVSSNCTEGVAPDVVYSFTLTAPAKVTLGVLGGPDAPLHPDPVGALFHFWWYDPMACINAGYYPRTFDLDAGTYDIAVDGNMGAAGDFALTLILEDL